MTTTEPLAAADVRDALERMRALEATLPRQDGIAVFNRVYLSVTDELERRIAAGHFRDPATTAEFTARFARRYLTAVDADRAGRRPPACWRPLFQQRRHPGVLPVQFALAGVNAHVGHDLALAVVDTCTARGCAPGVLRSDYERVDEVLVGLEERIREELMPGPDLLDVADPLTHLTGSWCLTRARDGAWAAARVLWELRGADGLREEFRERLDTGTGMAGRFLLTPLG
ncbi:MULTISPECIES: DUF5995 family protein [Streptomyces]|uniref:Uncharacterized protein n=2 Tax=Streptomyces TaxID=1883 RepID=A0A3R7FX86_9ACTN|nr:MULTISPECIES: DUF5995 family protein [Streptomyces]KNE79098.1 hypothetical protein ADZ36_29435 [Streptomyces fradiae]OFA36573.1 hypothetical protein BEN35_29990 [Streptomyces fradiae]PQM22378.1 hypothetical protein Sfr7A_15600 [Streptomyces xinghaiensis]RKM96655.1 hypothetical protein SFRA_011515 [Streptomyces xinghaiensis]RNC74193.1 hypothetical protein DC095_010630 [Streptomyces xinghaiensis]